MQYFRLKHEIDALMTAMQDLLTGMATQEGRIQKLEDDQILEGTWADDRERIGKTEDRVAILASENRLLRRRMAQLERLVDPHGDIDLT